MGWDEMAQVNWQGGRGELCQTRDAELPRIYDIIIVGEGVCVCVEGGFWDL